MEQLSQGEIEFITRCVKVIGRLHNSLECSTSRLFPLLASSEILRRMGGVQAQDKVGKGGFCHCSTQ